MLTVTIPRCILCYLALKSQSLYYLPGPHILRHVYINPSLLANLVFLTALAGSDQHTFITCLRCLKELAKIES